MDTTFKAKVPMIKFFGDGKKPEDITDEEFHKLFGEFGGERLKEEENIADYVMKGTVDISLGLESLLFQLFVNGVETPKSPLKVKRHEAWLNEIAEKLNKCEEESPENITEYLIEKIGREDLDKIKPILEDDEGFEKLSLQYEAKISGSESDKKAVISLPAINILNSRGMVDALSDLFLGK